MTQFTITSADGTRTETIEADTAVNAAWAFVGDRIPLGRWTYLSGTGRRRSTAPNVWVDLPDTAPTITVSATTYAYFVDGLIESAWRAIVADIEAGVVPASVRDFSDLHDYVDANTYALDALTEAHVEDLDGWPLCRAIDDALHQRLQAR